MPITTGTGFHPVLSTDSDPKSLNGDSILLNSLDDDEESFVVLERSTANDLTEISSYTPHSLQTLQNNCSFPVFNNLTTSEMSESRVSNHSRQAIPIESLVLPFDNTNISVSAEEIEKRLQEVLAENISLKENLYQTNLAMKQQLNTVKLLQDRASEVQKNHQSKFEETKTLVLKLGSEKTELQEANNALNQELSKLKEECKEIKETNMTFEAEAAKLKEECKGIKEANVGFGAEATKLLSENASLKKELNITKESLKTMIDNEKKASLQPTVRETELRDLVAQLTQKLETVERARRQQEFDIERLQAQLGRVTQELNKSQEKLSQNENNLQTAQSHSNSENSVGYGEKMVKYYGLLNYLEASVQEVHNSLNSWVAGTDLVAPGNTTEFEIAELRRLLTEEQAQSVARKKNLCDAVAAIHELISDYQNLGQELERVKAEHALKESHGYAYGDLQKKNFTERLDSLTARLVEKEEALAISERHLASLQEAVRLQNDEKKPNEENETLKNQVKLLTSDITAKEEKLKAVVQEVNLLREDVQKLRNITETIPVLEEQAKIYQIDFEAERKSRESVVAEREQLLEDLRHLQRRNQEVIEEVNKLREELNAPTAPVETPRRQEHLPTPEPPRPQDDVIPAPKRYFCPNPECNMVFTTLGPLQLHVITCLKLDD